MSNTADINKLKSSWTKYDIVKLVEIESIDDLQEYISGEKAINEPVLRAFLGVRNIEDELPSYWMEISKHPKYFKLFSLLAAITTHTSIINKMANFASNGNMNGVYTYDNDKSSTNLRSALVVSGAALQKYRKATKVPYRLTPLFENGEIGLIVKKLIYNRLITAGFEQEKIENINGFVQICYETNIIFALALKKNQFQSWVSGEALDVEKETFSIQKLKAYSKIPMLRINQWMTGWDDVEFGTLEMRRKPKPYFYAFSIDARLLKRLSDVHARNSDRNSPQRERSDRRVHEISKYIEGGFPWSTLTEEEQKSEFHNKLKMPGLLPTAIILNILSPGEKRNGKIIDGKDCLMIEDQMKTPEAYDREDTEKYPFLLIPKHIFNEDWNPDLKPIEIIDGQHRLWAFDESQNFNGNYELPVIAFDNLDRAWQAYLFYTINIKPVRINTSLGFDLYPMLRTQKWLEASNDGVLAYRENRAQELIELLWLYPNSPWHKRINMLGESGGPTMSQAAFVKTLMSSFFRKSKGLYASNLVKNDPQVLNWNRAQQAAFLILIWQEIKISLQDTTDLDWANSLREKKSNKDTDLAFTGKESFLARDQGVRPIMVFANDFFYTIMDESIISFNKFNWDTDLNERVISDEFIDTAIEIFKSDHTLYDYIQSFARVLIKVDWRTPSATLNDEEKKKQSIYRGSGGYTEYYGSITFDVGNWKSY